MPEFTEEEQQAIIALLKDDTIQYLMGTGEWDLTESQEIHLWSAIRKAESL